MARQQRGRERRDVILRAAISLLVEGGPRIVTHRAVARRAGVPVAATTYYFASLDELLVEAMQMAVDERLAELAQVEQSGDRLDLAYLQVILGRPTEQVIAQHELYLEAARNERLRTDATAAIESFERVAGRMVSIFGDRDTRRAQVALTALVDGLALHRIVRPLPPDEEFEIFRDAVRALLIAYMADDDEIATWRDRLQERLQSARPATATSGD
jgi:DNA-binding transcriptional regulator YbjK